MSERKRRFDDPNTPYPGRVWYCARWMTPEQIERKRESTYKYQRSVPGQTVTMLAKLRFDANRRGGGGAIPGLDLSALGIDS